MVRAGDLVFIGRTTLTARVLRVLPDGRARVTRSAGYGVSEVPVERLTRVDRAGR